MADGREGASFPPVYPNNELETLKYSVEGKTY